MSKPRPVVVGSKYNLLTIIKEALPHIQPNGRPRRMVNVSCDCGKVVDVLLENLYAGYSKSCGCLWEAKVVIHGMSKTSFKECHTNMKARCDNPQHPSYPDYGGRGITYCDKWKSFVGFIEDMYDSYSDKLTIDRIDVNGNYEKENCRWTNNSVQGHNKRKMSGCLFEYIGLRYNPNHTRYVASIQIGKSGRYLATFDSIEDAAKGYDDASEYLYGDRPNKTASKSDSIERIIHAKLKANKHKDKNENK